MGCVASKLGKEDSGRAAFLGTLDCLREAVGFFLLIMRVQIWATVAFAQQGRH